MELIKLWEIELEYICLRIIDVVVLLFLRDLSKKFVLN